MHWYNEEDISLDLLLKKKIGIVGFGNQGQAQSLNLRDSGFTPQIAQRSGSINHALAIRNGFEVVPLSELCKQCDFIQILVPDENQQKIFAEEMLPYVQSNTTFCFSHGFSIHMGGLLPPADCNVIMVSPKAQALSVRENYLQGKVTPAVFAVHQDATGDGKSLALAYAKAIGLSKGALFATTFAQECESDLFSEQAVICGGVVQLVQSGFEVLVEAGISPELAYIECLHELAIIANILHTGGVASLVRGISNTAEYGMYASGEKVISAEVKKRMKEVFSSIRNGDFAKNFISDFENQFSQMQKNREAIEKHPIETIGQSLRKKLFPTISPPPSST